MIISWKEKIGYGLGDLACNIIFQTVMAYLMFYYTDIAFIDVATVGIIFLSARIIDAISDPIMGIIVDKTHTRYGQFKPYLLFGSVILGIAAFACFTIPENISTTAKIIYASVTYIGLSLAYTLVNIPYSALTSAISDNPEERTKITSVRVMFAVISGMVVAQIGGLVEFFGQGNELLGYRYAIGFSAVLSTVLLWITFATTKERCNVTKEKNTFTIKENLIAILANKPLIVLSLVFLLILTAGFISFSINIYYLEHAIKRPDLIGTSIMVGTITTFLGTFIVPKTTQLLGKKPTASIAIMAYGLIHLLFVANYYTLNSVSIYIAIITLKGVVNAYTWAMGWAMVPDTIEYGEQKTGIRAEGLIYSSFSFCQKLGMALSGIITGIILSFFNYSPETGITQEAITGIVILFGYVPFILCLFAWILLKYYTLSEQQHTDICKDLQHT